MSLSPIVLVNHVSCSWNFQFFIYLLFVSLSWLQSAIRIPKQELLAQYLVLAEKK